MSLTVLVGSPRTGSPTTIAALAAARHVAWARGEARDAHLLELGDLAPTLLAPLPAPAVDAAVALIRSSEVLVVASPTAVATYTGLLKVFLDLLPSGALRGVTALPVLVVDTPAHALAVEVHLRPLLVELGAHVPTPGAAIPGDTVAADHTPGDGSALDQALHRWAARVTAQLPRWERPPHLAGDRG